MVQVRLKKGPQSIGKSRGGLTTKIHSIAADANLPIARCLSPGSAADDPVGQQLLEQVPEEMCKDKLLVLQRKELLLPCLVKIL